MRIYTFRLRKRRVKTYCIDCNKELSKGAVYISSKRCRSCTKKDFLRNPKNNPMYGRLGSLNPQWNGGTSFVAYPQEFNSHLKLNIRTRDRFTCQNCGIREVDHYSRGRKMVLIIHHINYIKYDCDDTNLITVCDKCNIKANFNRDYWYALYSYKIEELYSHV